MGKLWDVKMKIENKRCTSNKISLNKSGLTGEISKYFPKTKNSFSDH